MWDGSCWRCLNLNIVCPSWWTCLIILTGINVKFPVPVANGSLISNVEIIICNRSFYKRVVMERYEAQVDAANALWKVTAYPATTNVMSFHHDQRFVTQQIFCNSVMNNISYLSKGLYRSCGVLGMTINSANAYVRWSILIFIKALTHLLHCDSSWFLVLHRLTCHGTVISGLENLLDFPNRF